MPKNRLELQQEEKRLMEEIDQQSNLLEQKAEKTVKTSLIIGASILAGYTIYSLLSSGEGKTKKAKSSKRISSGLIYNPIVRNLFQSAVKKGIELLINEKQKNQPN